MKISLNEFIDLLPQLQARMQEATTKVMATVGQTVVEAAQAKIGVDQEDWPPLAEATIKSKIRQGFPVDPLLRTGHMRDSYGFEQSGNKVTIGNTDPVAEFQEVGTGTIPPRPVLLPAVYENEKLIETMIGEAIVAALTGGEVE